MSGILGDVCAILHSSTPNLSEKGGGGGRKEEMQEQGM